MPLIGSEKPKKLCFNLCLLLINCFSTLAVIKFDLFLPSMYFKRLVLDSCNHLFFVNRL